MDLVPPMPTSPMPDRILRRREVERRVGFSRSVIYRRIAAGTFPRPVDLGGGMVGWRESVIAKWIDSLPECTRHY